MKLKMFICCYFECFPEPFFFLFSNKKKKGIGFLDGLEIYW